MVHCTDVSVGVLLVSGEAFYQEKTSLVVGGTWTQVLAGSAIICHMWVKVWKLKFTVQFNHFHIENLVLFQSDKKCVKYDSIPLYKQIQLWGINK